jgi:hypothetical protein
VVTAKRSEAEKASKEEVLVDAFVNAVDHGRRRQCLEQRHPVVWLTSGC